MASVSLNTNKEKTNVILGRKVRTLWGSDVIEDDLFIQQVRYEIPSPDGGEPLAGAVLKYGAFIQNIIDFLIIAFCIFLMVKAMNKLTPKKEEEPAAPAGPTQEELLAEIRDLLKKK